MQIANLNMVTYGLAPIMHASRYDIGREFRFDLHNADREFIIPDNTWVIIHGLKPSKHTFAYSNRDVKDPTVVRYSGCSIYLKTTEEMTAQTGNTKCEFILRMPDGSIIGSLNFTLRVEEGALPNDVIASMAELIAYQRMMQSISNSYRALKYEVEATPDKVAKLKVSKKESLSLIAHLGRLMQTLQKAMDAFNATFNHIEQTTLKADGWKDVTIPATKRLNEDDVKTFVYDLGSEYKKRITYVELDTMEMTEEIAENLDEFATFGSFGPYVYLYKETKPTMDIPVIIGYTELTGKGKGNWNGYSSLWKDFEDETVEDELDEDWGDFDVGDLSGDDRHCCKDVRRLQGCCKGSGTKCSTSVHDE